MPALPLKVKKYLEKYGTEVRPFEWRSSAQIELIVVVPAISEYENIKKLLTSLEAADKKYADKILVMFVVNNLKSSGDEVKRKNQKTLEFLRSSLDDKNPNDSFSVGFIDAAGDGNELDEKNGGVGLARKIGMDTALSLFNYKCTKKKILVCLDADCTVSQNYFTEIYEEFNRQNFHAAVTAFQHSLSNKENREAILCYEIFLRYYVLSLRFAGSPYAFHTIGSTMICDIESYIKVEGMNKQKAAEDFYFLEKLAKNVSIGEIKNVVVFPSPRGSWRVPFGTGQRVNRFLSHIQNEYLLYNFNSFLILKDWLQLFLTNNFTAEEFLSEAEKIHSSLFAFLTEQKFEKTWDQIMRTAKTGEQLQRQKNIWFDGFKTLKLIHYLRDNGFLQQPMFASLNQLLKEMKVEIDFKSEEEIPPFEVQQKYLETLHSLENKLS
ncbi:MAG: glycosyltransferase family 2 protein [Ignavibacteriaceae bacterium]|jgi:glycosyltransferase involved in cell wall biosynthesis|nr:glycosyltransferase family 2 protein [Ignavibacteriaceae bacterium]